MAPVQAQLSRKAQLDSAGREEKLGIHDPEVFLKRWKTFNAVPVVKV